MAAVKYKQNPEYFEQLAFGLDLESVDRADAGFVSPDEARLRSLAARQALDLAGQTDIPEWFDQYQVLLNTGWPWRVACYIAWAASPKAGRWPKTQEELAREILGLTSDRQIGTWRRKNPSIDELIATLQAAPLLEKRADVFRALATSASSADHRSNPDRKLFLELTGDYVPRSKVEIDRVGDMDDLSQYSEEELKKLAALTQASGKDDGEV